MRRLLAAMAAVLLAGIIAAPVLLSSSSSTAPPPPTKPVLVAAAEPQPPPRPDHCVDYENMEAGTGHPENQHWWNYLDAKGYARVRLSCIYGGGTDQWEALLALWEYESGWYHLADGPGTCWGIPQRCPGSTMAPFGDDWRTNPRVQVRAGLDYVYGRYGDAIAARNFQRRRGWY